MLVLGLGIATCNQDREVIEAYFPELVDNPQQELLDLIAQITGEDSGAEPSLLDGPTLHGLAESLGGKVRSSFTDTAERISEQALATHRCGVLLQIDTDSAPRNAADGFLRLQCLSQRLVKPHSLNLDGIFGLLQNLAWTNEGPIELSDLPERQLHARAAGRWLHVYAVDKFPPMADYTVPAGVRIGDASRVRLGAYLGEGTTVMHEGFVNFNAGTEGASMIEGRISAGVMIGNGSDLGGGCSTMGTLSGGGKEIIKVGEQCLLGANAGTGIPLGNRCTIEAGLYLTAGTRVHLLGDQGQVLEVVKARELSGQDDLLFRRNSENGRVEALTNRSAIELNTMLHSND